MIDFFARARVTCACIFRAKSLAGQFDPEALGEVARIAGSK
jgi:hypothetical protein